MIKSDIAIASDHAGYELKEMLRVFLAAEGYPAEDLGTHAHAQADYPDFAERLAHWLKQHPGGRGVLICGSGTGMSIAANRFAHVRAALCREGLSARLARQHNDANVLCLGARFTGPELAKDCLREFLRTPFEEGRHSTRVAKLSRIQDC